MSYCPKCGNKVDETMVFCPHCGTALKGTATPNQVPPTRPYHYEKNERSETREHPEKGEKQEKNEHGFIGFLMGGLILMTVGVFALLDLTNPLNSSQDLAAMLLVIGVIIIVGAIFIATRARKWFPLMTHLKRFPKNIR